ncbi:hypothetical protein MAGGIE_19 [Arthrobacter phage Maggie]|uniref:Uncharacterized protein n=19 Tax=Decurrovirus decurro TaxID=1982105 RepID=A0A345M599_9CAUD|nr:hypothetical protein SEA_TYMABREU_19 [Arthrobacter phage TymAbreu]ALY09646.1 hypothetical protein MAGGIE_19 [Arthrobacter phage Maggie]ALY09749.1 hypothetical protein MOLOCH_19 [Arthrobacter phage Moloch]ALY10449.1 hypothetical protein STRATUS_19 [Arthrobacter phage Stratus]ALY10658.1 hypothetical protein TOULOUSE_18 [Arthrobacter phage Toulouse]AOQ28353.1 hypothetical protein SEA_MASSIMO_19 [Arthrobacter phage Massimo]AOT26116.1 hypothetical protein SEA_PROSPERO_19 [Arthrobacter phage Pro
MSTLPDSGTWTQPEVVRSLQRIERKLDNAATSGYVEAIKADQLRKDTEQDKAIESVEQNYNKLLLMVVGTAIGSAASLLVTLASALPK